MISGKLRYMTKQAVLIIADHGLDSPTADVPILLSLAQYCEKRGAVVYIAPRLRDVPASGYVEAIKNGFHHILPRVNETRLYNSRLFRRRREKIRDSYYLRLFQKYRPSRLFCFCYPNVTIAHSLARHKIHFLWIIYDPYHTQPLYKDRSKEEFEIANASSNYWVPIYFDEYWNTGIGAICHFYSFPLLPEKETVKKAIRERAAKYTLSYFGNFLPFRNVERAVSLANDKYDFHVFSDLDLPSVIAANCVCHPALHGADFYQAIADSSILIIFDNEPPYDCFFPSKVIHFVAFGLPILVFGSYKRGKLAKFLSKYDKWLYADQSVSDKTVIEFIERWKKQIIQFDEGCYTRYLDCAADNVWNCIAF